MSRQMEKYRNALHRYSTGQGFSVNVDPPQVAEDVASYKMENLTARLIQPGFEVDIKREADRISMQVEAANQQLKVFGYDKKSGKRYRNLKSRLDVMQHLITNYPIRYITKKDLERIYDLYTSSSPSINEYIHSIVEKNKGVKGIPDYISTAKKIRKGYPLYDQFGKKLNHKDEKEFKKGLAKSKGLSGFGESTGLAKVVAAGIVIVILFKFVL
jgi:hypothetical protein